nr:MAG TPA: hypothetical protein [Bacteriophage sp.]
MNRASPSSTVCCPPSRARSNTATGPRWYPA